MIDSLVVLYLGCQQELGGRRVGAGEVPWPWLVRWPRLARGACTGRDNFGSCAHESTDPVVVVCDANDPLDFI